MQNMIIIRETFSTRDDAEDACERLEYGGFARNRIDLTRLGNRFEVAIETDPRDRRWVEECLRGDFSPVFAGPRYAAPSAGYSILLVGTLAAVGTALYYGLRNSRDLRAQTYPSAERKAVRSLYQAHQAPSEQQRPPAASRQDCDLPENSVENLDRKLDHALEETFPTSDPVSVSITR